MPISLRRLLLLLMVLSPAQVTYADNSPESALARFRRYVLPKISFACGVDFSAEYDGESLRKHDEHIARDQSSGDRECNEPFRYLWFVCQTERGKAAVREAGVKGVYCKGTDGQQSTLFLSNGRFVLERSAQEDKPYLLLRRRFEELLNVPVVFGKNSGPDPYGDQTFSDLTGRLNPSLSKTDYCIVNDERLELMPLSRLPRVKDGKVKCWQAGQVIVDLTIKNDQETGLKTEEQGRDERVISHYRNGRLHGEQQTLRANKQLSVVHYEDGKRVWWREEHPETGLIEYSHQYQDGRATISMAANGKVYRLQCSPSAHDDKLLRVPCGFEAPRTTRIYDGTEKVDRIETWHRGVLSKRRGGDSAYSAGSEVAFEGGKKHGLERLTRADGSAEADIQWHHGVKQGREVQYDETGKKKVKEILWHADQVREVTELYLNGQRKSVQRLDGERAQEQTFWDNGQLQTETKLVACREGGLHRLRGYCEHGVTRSYYEDGTRSEEAQYKLGKRHGARHAFWPNGSPAAVERYADDVLESAKRWDEAGKLIADEEYERDGSRKQR